MRRKREVRARGRREELVHVRGVLVIRRQGRQVPVRLDRREDRVVAVRRRRGVCRLDDGTRPDRVDRLAIALIEREEESGPLGEEDVAPEDQRHEDGQVGVARRNVAVVHVVARVRREPHVVRGGRRRGEVGHQGAARGSRRDHLVAPSRIANDVIVVHKRIVSDRVVSGIVAVAVRRHVFHVRLPRQSGPEDPIDDAGGVPGTVRAGVRVRAAVVSRTSEVRGARETEVVRKARIHVAVVVLESDRIGVREGRHVRPGAAAMRVDVADVVVLHQDDHDMVEVEPGSGEGLDGPSGGTGEGSGALIGNEARAKERDDKQHDRRRHGADAVLT